MIRVMWGMLLVVAAFGITYLGKEVMGMPFWLVLVWCIPVGVLLRMSRITLHGRSKQ